MATADTPTPPEELGFSGALAELEQIVADLESSQLDVDVLATKVERAAELVAWCRQRIDGARLRVEEVVAGLDSGE